MRHVTLIAGAVCLTVVASTGAYTQVPPDHVAFERMKTLGPCDV